MSAVPARPRAIARGYRVVAEDGIASAAEMQAYVDDVIRKRRAQCGAAPTTVEAAMLELREDGIAALKGPSCQRRLAELSVEQLKQVLVRLDRLRPRYPKVTDDLLRAIAGLIR